MGCLLLMIILYRICSILGAITFWYALSDQTFNYGKGRYFHVYVCALHSQTTFTQQGKMWRNLLRLATRRRTPNLLRGSLKTNITRDTRLCYREASVSSLIPFGWVKKSEKTPQALVQAVEQTNTEGSLVEAHNKLKKFEKQEEKFIPVTRRTLVNRLVEEDGLLNWEEKRLLESFAASLDAYYSQKFYALLEEAKVRDHLRQISRLVCRVCVCCPR